MAADQLSPPRQPDSITCNIVPTSRFLQHAHSQWDTSHRGLRSSNRDCACLRLSHGFEVGSYPSWAIQPSILAWLRLLRGASAWVVDGKAVTLPFLHSNIRQVDSGAFQNNTLDRGEHCSLKRWSLTDALPLFAVRCVRSKMQKKIPPHREKKSSLKD